MAKKKTPKLSKFERRRIRTRQIMFAAVAVFVIASFVLSLINLY